MLDNYFFKWIYHLKNEELSSFKKYFDEPNESMIIKATMNKIKAWKKDGIKVDSAEWSRFRKKLENKKDLKEIDLAKELFNLKPKLYHFLSLKELEENPLERHRFLFKTAEQRNFVEAYFYHLSKRNQANNAQVYRSFDYWLEDFQIHYKSFFHTEADKHKEVKSFSPKETLGNAWTSLDKFSVMAKMRLCCELEVREWLFEEPSVANFEEVEKAILQYPEEDFPVGYFYLKLCRFIRRKYFVIDEDYFQFKKYIFEYLHLLPMEEKASVMMIILNWQIEFIKQNKVTELLYQELYDIASFTIRNGIFGEMYPIEYNMFITLFTQLKANYPEFAEELYTKYINSVNPEHQGAVFYLCKTFLAFDKGAFEESLTYLELIQHDSYTMTYRKGLMKIMARFEIMLYQEKNLDKKHSQIVDPEDVLEDLRNFERSVHHTKLYEMPSKQGVVEGLNNFIYATRLLVNHLFAYPIKELDDLLKKENLLLFCSDWLKEKYQSFENKRENN